MNQSYVINNGNLPLLVVNGSLTIVSEESVIEVKITDDRSMNAPFKVEQSATFNGYLYYVSHS